MKVCEQESQTLTGTGNCMNWDAHAVSEQSVVHADTLALHLIQDASCWLSCPCYAAPDINCSRFVLFICATAAASAGATRACWILVGYQHRW